MSADWRTTEKRLIAALEYLGVAIIGDERGAPWVISEGDLLESDVRVFSIELLARTLEHIK
jgi:hypothetical protein